MALSVFLLSCVALLILLTVFVERRRVRIARHRRAAILGKRGSLDQVIWYNTFFACHGVSFEAVLAVAELLAKPLQCELTSFRPEDSLSDTLSIRHASMFGFDVDDEWEEFEDDVLPRVLTEKELEGIAYGSPEMHTFLDLAQWFDRTISKRITS